MAESSRVVIQARSQSAAAPTSRDVRISDDGSLLSHPRYAELAARGKVFSFSVAAVTLPVNANNLVSVMGIYNPPNSGVLMEMIDVDAHYVLATTVVNALGLYWLDAQTGATFTTQGTIRNAGRLGDAAGSAVRAYSAVTYSGTPILGAICGGWGAVTDTGSTPIRKEFNGNCQVPPGVLVSLAMTTAASTASGFTGMIRWAEVPYVSN